MLVRIIILQTILSSFEGFKISESFLQCNKKDKVYDLKSKCLSHNDNGLNEIPCQNYSNQLNAVKNDEYAVINNPNGKEIIYSSGKEIFKTHCKKVEAIEVITNPENCYRDLKIQYMNNDQSNIGFLTKNGIIRNNSLQEKCLNNYDTFIKIKNFFIIKFKNKIVIKDENDIIKFEVNNENILFEYFEQFFKLFNHKYFSSIMAIIIIILFLIICFSKMIKKKYLKIKEFFVIKTKKSLDDSVIILESDLNLHKQTINKKKSKDKCVRFVDYDIDEVKKTKTTRSNKKSTKKSLIN